MLPVPEALARLVPARGLARGETAGVDDMGLLLVLAGAAARARELGLEHAGWIGRVGLPQAGRPALVKADADRRRACLTGKRWVRWECPGALVTG